MGLEILDKSSKSTCCGACFWLVIKKIFKDCFAFDFMVLEELREGSIKLDTLKYKAKAVILLVIGVVACIVGLVFSFQGNFSTGGIIILIGVVIVILSIFAMKSARHIAEVKSGVHGSFAQRRLMKRERRHR